MHHAEVAFHKGKAVVEEAARRRGMTEEQAAKVAKVVGWADQITEWSINFPVVTAVTGNPLAGKVSSFLPLGSAAYLAYSTARSPVATLGAAWAVLTGKAKSA